MKRAPSQGAPADPSLAEGLRCCEQQLAGHLEAAVRVLGAMALGSVELPPLSDSRPDAAQIRLAAVLLWAREVESAGLPGFVEALAERYARGRLALELDESAAELMQYHRRAAERFGAEERAAIYSQLFGGPGAPNANEDFPELFADYLDGLLRIAEAPAGQSLTHLDVRVGIAARTLGGSLSSRALGIAGFAARDIVANVREALELMHHTDLRRSLGGRSVWLTIESLAPRVLGHPVHSSAHLTRARAGMELLTYVADSAASPALPRLRAESSVVAAALAWSSAVPSSELGYAESFGA